MDREVGKSTQSEGQRGEQEGGRGEKRKRDLQLAAASSGRVQEQSYVREISRALPSERVPALGQGRGDDDGERNAHKSNRSVTQKHVSTLCLPWNNSSAPNHHSRSQRGLRHGVDRTFMLPE